MTVVEVVQDVAQKLGHNITAESAEYILWEHTGFPYFWNIPQDGTNPEECLRAQVTSFLNTEQEKQPC